MERLKELRTARGLLQKDVAAVLGIDRTTYVKYEKGQSEPSFDILAKLADYFGVSVDYLLGKTDIKKAPHGSEALQQLLWGEGVTLLDAILALQADRAAG